VLEFLRQLVTGVAQTWRRLSISARVQLALAALITIGLVAGAAIYGGQAQYGRLYSQLELEDANAIQVWLTDNDIPFRNRDGGTAVDIPVNQISRAKVGLAALDLPKSQGSIPGFELFDKRDLMSNSFLQNVDNMRAVRGELQRQLNQFEFVRNSYVFISEAPDELFSSDQQPSRATVTLDTSGKITPMQVKAVLQTVSSFATNLPKGNITIMDTSGTVLHGISDDAFTSLASDQLEVKVAYEKQAENKIRDVFAKLGLKAAVTVSAVMDWTSEEVSDTKKLDGAVVSSLKDDSETRDITSTPQGPPGAIANVPEELGGAGKEGIITTTTQKIDNFEPSQTLTKTMKRPGRLKQYKVGALIDPGMDPVLGTDGNPVLDANGKPQQKPREFTPERLAEFEKFIRVAVSGGDSAVETEVFVAAQPIEIDQITLSAPDVLPSVAWTESTWFNWAWRMGLVVLFFFVIRFLMRRALVIPTAEEEEVIEIPEASPTERRAQEIAAEVERLSQQEPDTVAALLRTWMSED